MHCYCVRHGQTEYNAEGRIQGQSDAPLSQLGVQQAAAVAAALAALPIEALYASPLQRAIETARPVATALKLPIRTDRRLMELNAGIFEDQLREEMRVAYPEVMACWMHGDLDYAIPGGESRRQLAARGVAAFRAMHAAGHQRVAVVSHGGLLTATLKTLLPQPPQLDPFSLANGSITEIDFTPERCILLALNRTEHLQGIASNGGDL